VTETNIVIPSHHNGIPVTAIGNDAFRNWTALQSVVILNGITVIGHNAFNGCVNLVSITLPDSLVSIGNDVFNGTALKDLVIPRNVQSIGNAFVGLTNLSVTLYYNNASLNVSHLRNVLTTLVVGEGVTVIPNNGFINFTRLTTVTMHDGVTSIGEGAFRNTGLTDITLSNSLVTIGNHAFENTALHSILLPDSLRDLGSSAFRGNTALTSITVPHGVTTIRDNTFNNITTLTTVTIPASVTTIQNDAFRNTTGLATVYFEGTQSQWGQIHIGVNPTLMNAHRVYLG
jgi:hypothetical protein